MKAVIVYGSPCAGKSTYIKAHAGENDLIYDGGSLVMAMTTRTAHLAKGHAASYAILKLRQCVIDQAKKDKYIDTLWIQCRWATDEIKAMLDGINTEEVFIHSTKEECYEHLENDTLRPDKDQWKEKIDEWFAKHHDEETEEDNSSAKMKRGRSVDELMERLSLLKN